jgi:hypothetical protein
MFCAGFVGQKGERSCHLLLGKKWHLRPTFCLTNPELVIVHQKLNCVFRLTDVLCDPEPVEEDPVEQQIEIPIEIDQKQAQLEDDQHGDEAADEDVAVDGEAAPDDGEAHDDEEQDGGAEGEIEQEDGGGEEELGEGEGEGEEEGNVEEKSAEDEEGNEEEEE